MEDEETPTPFEHQAGDCGHCKGYHAGMPRAGAIEELSEAWHADKHYFVPAYGRTLVGAACYLDSVAQMLYLDLESIGGVLKVGPGGMADITGKMPEMMPYSFISGIYLVPKGLPVQQMRTAFPGCFTDDQLPPEGTRILLPGHPERGAPFAPLMLDVLAICDLELADQVAANLQEMSSEPDL